MQENIGRIWKNKGSNVMRKPLGNINQVRHSDSLESERLV